MTTTTKTVKIARHMEIQETISSHQETYNKFLEFCQPIFDKLLAEKPTSLARRPQCSLRLPLLGTPDATLVVRPNWIKRRGIVPGITSEVVCRAVIFNSVVAKVSIGVKIGEDKSAWTRWSYKFGEELLSRMLVGMNDFMEDPEEVFQRSKDHCCLCGRHLTDEVSRSRGIGPECIKVWE